MKNSVGGHHNAAAVADRSSTAASAYRRHVIRRRVRALTLALLPAATLTVADVQSIDVRQPVVLIHGLARNAQSMEKLAAVLNGSGFQSCNVSYPSTRNTVEASAKQFVLPKIKECLGPYRGPVHFVTHSMGGIIVRYLATHAEHFEIGRVVMLSPPNQGSEVVDVLKDLWLFELINGPAGKQLDTASGSLPNQLGPARFELGVITGDRSINPILSSFIPGPDDGKVSIERAKLAGMTDFLIVHATHPFIMKNDDAIEQTIYFLRRGKFLRP